LPGSKGHLWEGVVRLEVQSRRASQATIRKQYGDAPLLDLTSRGPEPWLRFSPFYPHGDIPVPYSPGIFSMSVEGIWQGLKVFERADVDPAKFRITSISGIKRSSRSFGKVLGHREGVHGERLLPYLAARRAIYLPAYRWILDHCLGNELVELRRLAETQGAIILLDYETNCDVDDASHPLSHAGLVKLYLEGRWPQ
jgi:hypothetical protein